jgi:hypothetical protein
MGSQTRRQRLLAGEEQTSQIGIATSAFTQIGQALPMWLYRKAGKIFCGA